MSSELVERLRDYWLTLEPNVVICDRRVVDEAAARLEALKADLRRVSDEHSRIIEINKAHCKTINSYLVLNSRQEDKIKALEAEIARRARDGGKADG
ncbi:hypothetical protein [Aquamicrobium defluvii]|uniref:Uncharacterized protein n=1 Tax=Aquamicrobium defluvii TaxID=69279 RepID=A0A011U005_9HYPH|nr:hypothetical protein [Aquamicrobium defluvii]EXL09732.1 hypothetical protein BG36_21050 [Aquamicrobium defluvii]EZQ16484.1 hypothetical protein CF98_40670 [Halopseudomonas bauzanensis]